MSLRHQEILAKPGNAFENCQLDRKKYAQVLTGLIENYSNGFVLAINNKWGTGKTTFVKMWEQDLKDREYHTIYFNAWENDFDNSPLTALMGELKSLKSKDNEKYFKSAMQKASILTKHIAPTIVKAIAERYINIETINEVITDASKGLADIFENEVKEYSEKKKGIKEFKESLAEFIKKTNDEKPLVFIIDELDRCRPDYAVAILEQIKHFFSVQNIVFILSIDKIQLKNAICGVYGNSNIDSDEYLRRFIDIEYSLPEPEANLFYNYLYQYFYFDDFFESKTRKGIPELSSDKDIFLNACKLLFSNSSISLRQQEKIFSHSRLALRSFTDNNYVMPSLFLFLVYIKTTNEFFYKNINNKALSISELQNEFLEIVAKRINEDTEREILWLEAYLVNSYSKYINSYSRNNIYKYDSPSSQNVLLIQSVIDKSPKGENFLSALESMNRYNNYGNVSIEHLLKRINLTEVFKTK
jgi:hypothetical protein